MCKGTINMEDVYLINLDNIPNEQITKMGNPKWFQLHAGLPVDKCIGKEIEHLIQYGVITVGSCCGHGDNYPMALVLKESEQKLQELGYELYSHSLEHENHQIYEIRLMTGG